MKKSARRWHALNSSGTATSRELRRFTLRSQDIEEYLQMMHLSETEHYNESAQAE